MILIICASSMACLDFGHRVESEGGWYQRGTRRGTFADGAAFLVVVADHTLRDQIRGRYFTEYRLDRNVRLNTQETSDVQARIRQ